MDQGPRPEVVIPAVFGSFFVLSISLCLCCGYLQKRYRKQQIQQISQTCNQHAQYMACNNAYPYGQPPAMENRTLPQVHLPRGVIPGRVIGPYYQQLPPSAPLVDPAGFSNLQELPDDPPPRYEELQSKQGFGLPSQQLQQQQQQPPYPVVDKY